jgi:hypothetical protein
VQVYKLKNLCLVTVVYPALLLVLLVLQKEGGRFKIVHIACCSVAIPRKKIISRRKITGFAASWSAFFIITLT